MEKVIDSLLITALSIGGGGTYSWAPPDLLSAHYSDSADHHTFIQAASSNSIYFFIHNDNTSPRNYNITLSAILNGVAYPDDSAATTVTEYGIPGGYIIGTASGQMKAQDSKLPTFFNAL